MKLAVNRKCDKPMRRSKEKCNTPNFKRWKCDKDCKNCICGMYMTAEGNWHHNNLLSKLPTEVTE